MVNDIFRLIKSFWNFIKHIWGRFSSFIKRHPYKTLSITHVNREMACWWHMGSRDGNKAMQVGVVSINNRKGRSAAIVA